MFNEVFDLQIMFFVLLFLGYFLRKRDVITVEGKKSLNRLLLYVVLPCNIVNAFRIELESEILEVFVRVLLISVAIQFMCWLIGKFGYNWIEPRKRSVLQYATACSNAGFIGNPIAEGVFGTVGLLYTSAFLIPQRIIMWSAGISYFTTGVSFKERVKKVLLHPCIIAVIIGGIIMFLKPAIPTLCYDIIKKIGDTNTVLSMLIIGTVLAEVPLKSVFSKEAFLYSILRLVILPLIVFLGCKAMGFGSEETGISVVLTAMPAGSTSVILAQQYDGDSEYAIKLVVLSTLLLFVSLPIWLMII
jgi:Predicted permeases